MSRCAELGQPPTNLETTARIRNATREREKLETPAKRLDLVELCVRASVSFRGEIIGHPSSATFRFDDRLPLVREILRWEKNFNMEY